MEIKKEIQKKSKRNPKEIQKKSKKNPKKIQKKSKRGDYKGVDYTVQVLENGIIQQGHQQKQQDQ